jgi:hypothetical protein
VANKATVQEIPAAKLLETLHIVRFALATRVIGDAEPVFDVLRKKEAEPKETLASSGLGPHRLSAAGMDKRGNLACHECIKVSGGKQYDW